MMAETFKNTAAVTLGRKGGLARRDRLSESERSSIARSGGKARWDRHAKVQHPTIAQVISKMLVEIAKTGKAHALFVGRGYAEICEVDSDYMRLWMVSKPETCVGTYGLGAEFSAVMADAQEL